MIDELDLAFDEHAEKGKPRHRRGARGSKKGSGKSGIAFVMAFVLLAVLGGGAYFGYNKVKDFFTAADYDGAGGDPIQVTIAKNATLTEIGNTLVEGDVVKSTKAFIQAADANPKGKNIQSGTYNLKKQMSAETAVTLLLDPKARVTRGVTLREGLTMMQTFELLSKATKIPYDDFVEAAKEPTELGVAPFWFNRRDGKPARKSIEGFLFPDTYEFDPKLDAKGILEVMVAKFNDTVIEMGFVDTVQKNLSISPFEALIVASLAQAESGAAPDTPKIARVAYNRAYVQKPPMPLQFDVTANYWLQLKGGAAKHSGQLSKAELNDPKNPYNSVSLRGLTPGPIDSPGKAALQAAMKPATGPWLFFVAVDQKGNSAFATTDAEHERNIDRACANGIKLQCD